MKKKINLYFKKVGINNLKIKTKYKSNSIKKLNYNIKEFKNLLLFLFNLFLLLKTRNCKKLS